MDEQQLAEIEQVFATVTNTLRTGSRGGAWRYDVTQFDEAGSALLAEVRRLRAALGCISRYGPRVQIPTAISCASAALRGNAQPCSYLHEHGERAR